MVNDLFQHEGLEVGKGGLRDGCGPSFRIFAKNGRKEGITLRHALNRLDPYILRGKSSWENSWQK
jgi:hypothetical protein